MATLSLDIRQRILARYDEGKDTRDAIAKRFCVSLGMVKKLIQQRKRLGEIGPLHHRAGRKPTITPRHRDRLRALIEKRSDTTLVELRTALRLRCSLTAIHKALAKLGLPYKKRHSVPVSKIART
jgi:transposase